MRHTLTTSRGPPGTMAGDGGYPVDSDLHQMSDEGCPHSPDPARWADPDWRDNLGEWDAPDPPGEVAIRRCPYCPSVGEHALGVAAAVARGLGLYARVIDGVAGEFTVLVDGRAVFRKAGDALPGAREVVEAVRVAVPAGSVP